MVGKSDVRSAGFMKQESYVNKHVYVSGQDFDRKIHMPLDGHSFLVSQGWSGKGSGLRQGAIAKPLAIPQKKNLSGLGKDRDEAFPFWDQ